MHKDLQVSILSHNRYSEIKMIYTHKHTHTHTHTMEYYSAIKMRNILPFVTTQMDPEGILLDEINQTEKE